jgi:trans-2,3-dihydro-3-hydroxyanthranilate isomerase
MNSSRQKEIKFIQADVFTDTAFGGNPVAVFPDAADLTTEEMQKVAREMSLSETAFALAPTDPKAQVRIRFFTPTQEIPFAGHPTLGTIFILAQKGRFPLIEPVTRIHSQTEIGILPVDLCVKNGEIQKVVMVQPKHTILAKLESEQDFLHLAAGLSIHMNQIFRDRFPVEVVSTGFPVMIVPLRSLTAVKEIQIKTTLIEEICARHRAHGVMVFSLITVQPTSNVHTRMFAPSIGIIEDAATGSASGALGAYLVRHRAVTVRPTTYITIEQGYEVDRPSTIYIQVDSYGQEITEVRVGGEVIIVLEGVLTF